jgi:ribosomal protein S18 acetylase RimI-like enzyme
MSETTCVRAVREGELDQLHAIRLRALRDSPDAFMSTYEEERTRTPFSRLGWVRQGVTLVAEDSTGWHGLTGARLDPRLKTRVEIVSMWVAPERRGEGLGTALLRGALEWARARGALTARLAVVEGNEHASSLYYAHGFAPTGEREPLPASPARDILYLELSLR